MNGMTGFGGADCFTHQVNVADKKVASAVT